MILPMNCINPSLWDSFPGEGGRYGTILPITSKPLVDFQVKVVGESETIGLLPIKITRINPASGSFPPSQVKVMTVRRYCQQIQACGRFSNKRVVRFRTRRSPVPTPTGLRAQILTSDILLYISTIYIQYLLPRVCFNNVLLYITFPVTKIHDSDETLHLPAFIYSESGKISVLCVCSCNGKRCAT